MRKTTILAALALALVASPCSSDRKSPEELCPNPVETTEAEMGDFFYVPTCVGVDEGATLSLENTGGAPHTFTVVGTEADANVAAGDTAELDLTGVAPGTYEVICTYHPQMTAAVRVT